MHSSERRREHAFADGPRKPRGDFSLFRVLFAVIVQFALLFAGIPHANAATIDLVVNIVSDQPAYLSFALEHFTVTVSNNGPDSATNVFLVVNHPVADVPFELSATCQPVAGPNPNGPAVCPPGSGIAGSGAFTRVGQSFNVTIPVIPSQSQAKIQFDNRARCPAHGSGSPSSGQESRCSGAPLGNYPVTATVSATQSDVLNPTNTATTNIFLYGRIEYSVAITNSPVTTNAGQTVDYEFELRSTGSLSSDRVHLNVSIRGLAGDMTPLTSLNDPYLGNGSTLPDTQLKQIDCLSTTLGTFPLASVFPSVPASWQTCPTTALIPRPIPTSATNSPSITGFPSSFSWTTCRGARPSLPGGGVIRFKATVVVGHPVCVNFPETGTHRDLEFTFKVTDFTETPPPPLGVLIVDNTATVTTPVPGTCKEADIEFTTTGGIGVPLSFPVNGSGVGTWTNAVTVSNISSGVNAGTATNVPVTFEHHQFAFIETQGPLTCIATGGGVCPPLAAGSYMTGSGFPFTTTVSSSTSGFSYTSTIESLPPGATVTFSQPVTETRTACWSGPIPTPVNLSGNAGPSPALFDPNFSPTTPPQPIDFTSSTPSYFGNNGQQTRLEATGLVQCPGTGGTNPPPPGIMIVKSGPFASAAAANAGTPLIGQTAPPPSCPMRPRFSTKW